MIEVTVILNKLLKIHQGGWLEETEGVTLKKN